MRKLALALLLAGAVPLPAAAQTVQERLPTCLACHGENGQLQNPGVPSLGAQQTFYVTVQLLMFRERMRTADPMNDMAKGLSDDDLRSFADIIAKPLPPQPAPGPVDAARIVRGQACPNGCWAAGAQEHDCMQAGKYRTLCARKPAGPDFRTRGGMS